MNLVIILECSTSELRSGDTKWSLGVNFRIKSLEVDGKAVKLQIWHLSSEKRWRFSLPTYVKNTKGGIFMYDITNYSSLVNIDDWLTIIRKKNVDLFPILVVGMKSDLNKQREVSSEEARKIVKSRKLDGDIECSAKTGENVEEIFETLTKLMLQQSGLVNEFPEINSFRNKKNFCK